MVDENLLKPSLAGEFLGAHLVLVIDAVLLDLAMVEAEVASE